MDGSYPQDIARHLSIQSHYPKNSEGPQLGCQKFEEKVPWFLQEHRFEVRLVGTLKKENRVSRANVPLEEEIRTSRKKNVSRRESGS